MKLLLFLENANFQNLNPEPIPISNKQTRALNRLWRLMLGVSLVLGVWCLEFPQRVCAQGPLTPPGTPAPTMKSLDQIEPRTPISSGPFTINSPGSYYLTGNLTASSGSAITINASGVTVDLNGFTISSTSSSPSAAAIFIQSGASKTTILNGSIDGGAVVSGGNWSGGGFSDGIYAAGTPKSVRVFGVEVTNVVGYGIYLGGTNHASVVESCIVQAAGYAGIWAPVVRNSTASNCAFFGINADEASDSFGSAISSGGDGISGTYSVINCGGSSSTGYGIVVYPGVAENCYGESTSGTGLSGYTVQNCNVVSNAGTALNGIAITNCFASNSSTANPTITGTTVRGCYGFNSVAGPAISATHIVADSVGYSTGGSGINIISAKTVSNSYATAATTAGATGISADVVQNCSASVIFTGGGFSSAIHANDSVSNSVGLLTGTNGVGTAILAPNISNSYGSAGSGNSYGLSGTNISYSYGVTTSGPGAGINVQNGTVAFCAAQNASGDGIFADRSTVKSCSIASSTNGIRVGNVCLIEGNTCDANTTGIRVIGNSSTLDSNRVSCPAGGNAFVFESTGTNNFIIRNTVRENGSNPFILTGANNHYGPLVNVSGVVGGDISGTTNANHPWANFIY